MTNRFTIAVAFGAIFASAPVVHAASPEDAAIKQAATEIIRVLKTQGAPGMQAYVQNCYAQQGQNLHCLYLDAGASQINNYMAGVMNAPRNPYFFGLPYAQRIGPTMKAAGIVPEQQGVYLKNLYSVQRSALYAAYVAK
ncbi:hypothetical protein [Aestuariivirga litoralis]|uniref:hypothetical protein n=1 Tax=Aestuariivirga litoralis TaxID=2650924 RepID=UPI0018C678EB|nr:hypothetical protein [Aestuariivirga litoralis]MBG1231681.1 hypothetical protein [Aestuariivirga litoralis]